MLHDLKLKCYPKTKSYNYKLAKYHHTNCNKEIVLVI